MEAREQKNNNDNLQNYTSTISHEFRTPLGTSKQFLQSVLDRGNLHIVDKKEIELVLTQLSLLENLVQGVLDIKLIE